MPRTDPAYSTPDDLLIAQLRVDDPDKIKYVNEAADDIESRIGHIYETPLTFDTSVPQERAASLVLKRLNNNLASGRIILAYTMPSEDKQLNAYGQYLVQDAEETLELIASRQVVLYGPIQIVLPNTEVVTGAALGISNVDSSSRVDDFYAQPKTLWFPPGMPIGWGPQ